MTTDSAFRQMATKILADAFGADGTGSPLHSAIETALAAAWAQGRDVAAEWKPTHQHYKGGLYQVLHEATDEYGQWAVIVYKAADGRIWTRQKHVFNETMPDGLPRFRALTPAAVPSKENGE